MLLVYTDQTTPRIDYIFRFILGDIAGLDYRLTSHEQDFIAFEGPKFSYGYKAFDGVAHMQAFGLLHQEGIFASDIPTVMYDGGTCPFAVQGLSLFPFDLFSAAFYLVTRYEEYLPGSRDQHGRYRAVDSLAYRLGFLEKPVVNSWGIALRNALLDKFPGLPFKQSSYRFISTVDVDQAYAYKGKDLKRVLGRFVKSMLQMKMSSLWNIITVRLFHQKDPYDTFDYIISLKQKKDLELIFFLHLGDHGTYDKSLRWDHPLMNKLVQKLSANALLGIHPSYRSHENKLILQEEMQRYKHLMNQMPKRSRQHFLKMSFPHTYQYLIEKGIQEDYTLGYADRVGFRASVCVPFFFYDLTKEEQTNLLLFPFVMMEGILKDYMHCSISEANQLTYLLIEEVKKVNGVFISIWHNHSLSKQGEWLGWNEVYSKMVKRASKK